MLSDVTPAAEVLYSLLKLQKAYTHPEFQRGKNNVRRENSNYCLLCCNTLWSYQRFGCIYCLHIQGRAFTSSLNTEAVYSYKRLVSTFIEDYPVHLTVTPKISFLSKFAPWGRIGVTGIKLHKIWTPILDGGEWPASLFNRFTPGTPWTEGLQADVDVSAKRKFPDSTRNWTAVVQTLTSNFSEKFQLDTKLLPVWLISTCNHTNCISSRTISRATSNVVQNFLVTGTYLARKYESIKTLEL